jgi:hypothetical protein
LEGVREPSLGVLIGSLGIFYNYSRSLALYDPWYHHVVVGTEALGVLVGGLGEGNHVIAQVTELHHLVDKAADSAVDGSALVLVFLGELIHFVDDGLQVLASVFVLD